MKFSAFLFCFVFNRNISFLRFFHSNPMLLKEVKTGIHKKAFKYRFGWARIHSNRQPTKSRTKTRINLRKTNFYQAPFSSKLQFNGLGNNFSTFTTTTHHYRHWNTGTKDSNGNQKRQFNFRRRNCIRSKGTIKQKSFLLN